MATPPAMPRDADALHIETRIRPFEIPRPGFRKRQPIVSGQRIVAIGDIHGCWHLLCELIVAIDKHLGTMPREHCRLIILGDFIDRGPSSDKVIALLREASERFDSTTILQGNHEASLIASARGDAMAQREWIEHGGSATLSSFGIDLLREGETSFEFGARIVEGIGVETLDWIDQLPIWLHLPPFFFCHAGIRPGLALDRQHEEDLLWIRKEFTENSRNHGAIVVHGHSISPDVEIRHNRIGIDTGAFRTGMLSAAVFDPGGNWTISTGYSD